MELGKELYTNDQLTIWRWQIFRSLKRAR